MSDFIRDERGEKHIATNQPDTPIQTIPPEFYARVLAAHTSISQNSRFWSTSHLILQQAMEQLDPDCLGLAIWIVSCMPPSGPFNKVRSLRENVGIGTSPWPSNLGQNALFLGAESLAGDAVTYCRPGIIHNLEKEHNLKAASHIEHEKSAAIYPILCAGRIAGVLLVLSTQIDYFLLPGRTELIQAYADLTALAFKPEDFYPPEKIALGVMPLQEEQKSHFSHFRQMVESMMIIAAKNNRPISNQQADMLVWTQLEEKLLSSDYV